MIATGNPLQYEPQDNATEANDVVVLDPTKGYTNCSLPHYPLRVRNAAGGMVDTADEGAVPLICGGTDSEYTAFVDECYLFSPSDRKWVEHVTLETGGRIRMASVTFTQWLFLIGSIRLVILEQYAHSVHFFCTNSRISISHNFGNFAQFNFVDNRHQLKIQNYLLEIHMQYFKTSKFKFHAGQKMSHLSFLLLMCL